MSIALKKSWIDKANSHIELLQVTDSNIHGATIIVPDAIGKDKVYLAFGESQPIHIGLPNPEELKSDNVTTFEAVDAVAGVHTSTTISTHRYFKKSDFIFATDAAKHDILDKMFAGQSTPHHSSHDGRYEMFYPYQVDGKTVAVLYLTDYLAYGKISGS